MERPYLRMKVQLGRNKCGMEEATCVNKAHQSYATQCHILKKQLLRKKINADCYNRLHSCNTVSNEGGGGRLERLDSPIASLR